MHFFKTIFFHCFLDAIFVCFEKKFSRFFPPIFRHDIRVFIKKHVFALFKDDFFPSFFLAIYECFWKKYSLAFFFPHFWSQFSCVYKKRVFELFGYPIRVFLEIIFSRVFFLRFFGHDIRVFIKNVFLHFFKTIFSIVFWT